MDILDTHEQIRKFVLIIFLNWSQSYIFNKIEIHFVKLILVDGLTTIGLEEHFRWLIKSNIRVESLLKMIILFFGIRIYLWVFLKKQS